MDSKISYIFIDESGDLGKFGSRYFVIAALCTTNPEKIYHCIKKVRERKLKKKLNEVAELKGNNSNEAIRKAVLKGLIKCDCEIHIITVDKTKVRDYLFNNKNKLYNYIAGILFEHVQYNSKDFHLIIDKKDNKGILRKDFNDYIQNQKKRWNAKIEIEHLESHRNRGLQAVDFVAWCINRKYNTDDDSFYKIIEPKITYIKNLFS